MTSDENISKNCFALSLADIHFVPSVHSWLIHYTSLLHSALDIILGRRQPIYSHILDIDRKIRDFEVPISWRMPLEHESSRPNRNMQMYRWLALSSKEISEWSFVFLTGDLFNPC